MTCIVSCRNLWDPLQELHMLSSKRFLSVHILVLSGAFSSLYMVSSNVIGDPPPPCSGQTQADGNCSTAHGCPGFNASTNPNCTGNEIVIFPKPLCTSVGASPGDNCITTTSLETCGVRYACVRDTDQFGGFFCKQDNQLGQVQYYITDDGGDCVVGSGG